MILLIGIVLGWHLDREDKGKAKIYPGVAAAYVIEENHVYLKAASRYAAAAKVYEELFGEDCPQALEARAKQAEAQEHIQQLEPQEKEFQDKSWPEVFHFANSKTRFAAEMKKRHPLAGLIYVYSPNFTRPHRVLALVCRILGVMFVGALFDTLLFALPTCDPDFESDCDVEVPFDIGLVFAVSVGVLVAATPLTSLMKFAIKHVAMSSESVSKWRQCEKMENVHAATRNLRVYNKTHKVEDDDHSFKAKTLKTIDKWWSVCVLIPQLGPEEELEVEHRFQADLELRKLQDDNDANHDSAVKKLFKLTQNDMRKRAFKKEIVNEQKLYQEVKFMGAAERDARLLEASREAQMTARQRSMYHFNRLQFETCRRPVRAAHSLIIFAALLGYVVLTCYYVATFAAHCRSGVTAVWMVGVLITLALEMVLLHPLQIFATNVVFPRFLAPVLREIDSSEQCTHFKSCLSAGLTLHRATKMAIRGGSDHMAMLGNLQGADALRAAILAAQMRGDDGPLNVSLADLSKKKPKALSLAEKLKQLEAEKVGRT